MGSSVLARDFNAEINIQRKMRLKYLFRPRHHDVIVNGKRATIVGHQATPVNGWDELLWRDLHLLRFSIYGVVWSRGVACGR